jgi:alkanesulfonate monooxygenase SsuD/methylene tetrahydromethanopterin reductase-like flavin-dependent oxidoreductase (luciferase family)
MEAVWLMVTPLGFACSGGLAIREIAELASAAELRCYDSFWITVVRGVTDPVAVLRAALSATSCMDIGLGLIPLDAYEIDDVATRLSESGARAIVGLGVGGRREEVSRFWRDGAAQFRRNAPLIRIAVGGYGPQVLRAGGGYADAALLNWMTPDRVRWVRRELQRGARGAARTAVPDPVYVYVPTAVGEDAGATIGAALRELARYGYHRRHQTRLGANPQLGLALDPSATPRSQVPHYGPGTRTVIHPLRRDADSHRAILRLCASV